LTSLKYSSVKEAKWPNSRDKKIIKVIITIFSLEIGYITLFSFIFFFLFFFFCRREKA